jgi:hypothetical protein
MVLTTPLARWAMLDIRWLCSVTSFLHPLYFAPSLTLYPLIGQLSPDFPPSYACLGRREQLSLKEYPVGTGRLLARGEPISKFGFDLGFVKISFRPRFVVGLRGQGCPRSQAFGGKNCCDTRTYFSCIYNFVVSLWPLPWTCVLVKRLLGA